ncbi:MAG: hypothetical protein WCI18_01745 [Pseudomonadota bacterium]
MKTKSMRVLFLRRRSAPHSNMTVGVFALWILSFLTGHQTAYATASFQAGGGLQKANLIADNGESTKLNFKGATKILGAHMQPLTALPVGLGIVLSQSNLKGADRESYLSLDINAVSVEVSTWTKAGPVAFFLRGGKVVGSEAAIYRPDSKVQSLEYSATHGSLGVATSLSPSISLMLEMKQSFGGAFDYLYGEEVLGKPRHLTSSSVLLGIEFGA